MNKRDATTLANKLMRQHGLKQQGWVLQWDKAVSRSGYCSYRKKVISLSEPITLLNPKSEVLDTILHEIAHALMPGSGHNMYWRSMAMSIGASGSRCAAPETKVPPKKWIAYCPNGHTHKTNRRALRSPRSCGRCSRRFDPQFIIKYKANTEGLDMAVSKDKGERAMEYISDYPLYASTSGITYDEAVAVAKALNPQWEAELEDNKRFEALSQEEKKKELGL